MNNKGGYCECGCGELAPIAKYSHAARGWVKGQPKRFINGHWARTWIRSEESNRKISESKRGKTHTEESKKNMSIGRRGKMTGEDHWNWKGGITPENTRIRRSLEYKEWTKSVLQRDKYTCQDCGRRGWKLQAHHIKPFAIFIELRFDLDNGITLCKECHDKIPRVNYLCDVEEYLKLTGV